MAWSAVVLVAALTVGASVVASMVVLRTGMIRISEIRANARTLSVTGSARKRVRSDLVVWSAVVRVRNPSLAAGVAQLRGSAAKVVEFLRTRQIPETDIQTQAVSTREIHPRVLMGDEVVIDETKAESYELTQEIRVTSREVDRVGKIARDVTELMENGIDVESSQPAYSYTQLQTLKIELIADASKDTRTRAEQIVVANHARLGRISSARIGVVQINAANESDVSWDGVYNTTSVEKDAFVTVNTTYEVD